MKEEDILEKEPDISWGINDFLQYIEDLKSEIKRLRPRDIDLED